MFIDVFFYKFEQLLEFLNFLKDLFVQLLEYVPYLIRCKFLFIFLKFK